MEKVKRSIILGMFFLIVQLGYVIKAAPAAPSAIQTPAYAGRYSGEEQSRAGTRYLTVALRTNNVAIAITEFPNQANSQREKGRWETIGRNRVRVIVDNGDEYEFTYSNDTLIGGRTDRRTKRVLNRVVLTRVSRDGDVETTANLRELNLSESGDGDITPSGIRRERVTNATVVVTNNGRAALTFQTDSNRTLRYLGWVTQFDNNSLQITLVNSNNDNVSGTARVSYQGNRRINSINLSGLQGTRRFTVSFNGRGGDTNQPGGGGSRPMTLRDRGNGFVQFGTGNRETLASAALEVNSNEDVEITLRRSSFGILRFSGRVERMGNGSLFVRLSNSGNADASGTVEVRYREPNTISSLRLNGTVDRRQVTAEFTGDANPRPTPGGGQIGLPIEWTQNGNGSFELGTQARVELTRAIVSVDRNEQATIEFRDRSNRLYRFTGRLVSREGNSLRINLTELTGNAGSRTINGFADIDYGRNVINDINIYGRLGNERLYLDFNR